MQNTNPVIAGKAHNIYTSAKLGCRELTLSQKVYIVTHITLDGSNIALTQVITSQVAKEHLVDKW